MSYLGELAPQVHPDDDDGEFWRRVAQRVLAFQRCADCRAFQHPPLPRCSHCGSSALDFEECSGEGTVYTFTIVHHAALDALAEVTPYNITSVLMDGCGDVRLVSNVVDVRPEELFVGQRVKVTWDEVSPGSYLPRFVTVGRTS